MTATQYAEEVKTEMDQAWLSSIYKDRVLGMRTRSYDLGTIKRSPLVGIQHTLLGVELKIGNKRLLCPDLATARYLSVFARIGCETVAVPYDITKLSQLADLLESSWYRMLLLGEQKAAGKSSLFKTRIRGLLIAKLREEISRAGAGPVRPAFKSTTKQRT